MAYEIIQTYWAVVGLNTASNQILCSLQKWLHATTPNFINNSLKNTFLRDHERMDNHIYQVQYEKTCRARIKNYSNVKFNIFLLCILRHAIKRINTLLSRRFINLLVMMKLFRLA